ncbi:MAG TPA: rhomboid family intramembrane serine protease [Ferruginibacter sp.]|jgi:rhomboid protease GluP|nr:rhomboid family intramembrane serine protease [Ferruginibacter sp.]
MTTALLLQKFKIVYSRLLVITISFIIAYTFLRWLLFIKFNVFDLREDVLNFWLPIVLPWIPLLIWLQPRTKLFSQQTKSGKKKNPAMGYLLLASFAIAVPTIIAQSYLETATGKLTALSNIGEISQHAPTKYYTLKNYYIDKDNKQIKYSSDVSGKHDEDLNLHIYIASPLTDKINAPTNSDSTLPVAATSHGKMFVLDGQVIDSATVATLSKDSIASITVLKGEAAKAIYGDQALNGAVIIVSKQFAAIKFTPPVAATEPMPVAWLCIHYDKEIRNRLSDSITSQKETDFYNECVQNFADSNLNSFVYLDRINHTVERDGYKKAIEKLGATSAATVILEPRFDAFENRNGNNLLWVFGSFGIGMTVLFLILLLIKFDADKLNSYLEGRPQVDEDAKSSLSFKPKEGFYATPIIMYINTAVFIAMVCAGLGFLSFDTQDLLKWGADYGPYTTNGQWWRLFTSIFVHAGFMHLFANMYGLLFVGIFLEPVLGKNKYAIAYVVTGIIASITSLYWHPATVSIGASGAVFGLYGVFIALLLLKVFPKGVGKAFLIFASVFIAYNLVIGLMSKGVDNAAHIGGLVSGFILGLYLKSYLKDDVSYTEPENAIVK